MGVAGHGGVRDSGRDVPHGRGGGVPQRRDDGDVADLGEVLRDWRDARRGRAADRRTMDPTTRLVDAIRVGDAEAAALEAAGYAFQCRQARLTRRRPVTARAPRTFFQHRPSRRTVWARSTARGRESVSMSHHWSHSMCRAHPGRRPGTGCDRWRSPVTGRPDAALGAEEFALLPGGPVVGHRVGRHRDDQGQGGGMAAIRWARRTRDLLAPRVR